MYNPFCNKKPRKRLNYVVFDNETRQVNPWAPAIWTEQRQSKKKKHGKYFSQMKFLYYKAKKIDIINEDYFQIHWV